MRPRSALARTVYDKMKTDQEMESFDRNQWYQVDFSSLRNSCQPETTQNLVCDKFVQFNCDPDTAEFIQSSVDITDNVCWQLWMSVAGAFLRLWLHQTTVNGMLGRGSMHVFSASQFQSLIDYRGQTLDSMLDIGAGDGSTTVLMAHCFHKVYATEMSSSMKKVLADKGITLLDEINWPSTALNFSVITCLNVLDRCSDPLKMLDDIKARLEPGGIAIISFVIPYSPFVEFDKQFVSTLPIKDGPSTFLSQASQFISKVLEPNGWELVKWTRLPYLCEGDLRQSYYWLDDAVFVIRNRET